METEQQIKDVIEPGILINDGSFPPTTVNVDADFLSGDLSGVDTDFPLVKEGPAELEISKVEKLANKKGTGHLLKITLKATCDLETVKGDVVHKGYPFYKQIAITPTPEYDESMIKRAVALFVKSLGGERLFPLQQWEGQVAPCRITIRKERKDKETGETYPASNEIKFVIP